MTTSTEILERLVSFETVSLHSNMALIDWVRDYLHTHGVASEIIADETGSRANLHAVIGPAEVPGVMLSGHTDVVPVEGQAWSSDPYRLIERDGRLYARGSADMKGFLACVLALVPEAVRRRLARPVHIAFSYDEEVGCIGVRRLIDVLEAAPVKPAFCIVGEPTRMEVIVSHKGKTSGRMIARGLECHSSLMPQGVNAIYLAVDMIAELRAIQAEIEASGHHDHDFDVPYSTLHVGTIAGGTALNIVPNHCELAFEIRDLPREDVPALVARLEEHAAALTAEAAKRHPAAGVEVVIDNEYPALETGPEEEVVTFVKSLLGANSHGKVAYGTEGGLFSGRLGVPTVVCGPGDIAQAHKPDEFIALSEMEKCERFLARLLDRLSA